MHSSRCTCCWHASQIVGSRASACVRAFLPTPRPFPRATGCIPMLSMIRTTNVLYRKCPVFLCFCPCFVCAHAPKRSLSSPSNAPVKCLSVTNAPTVSLSLRSRPHASPTFYPMQTTNVASRCDRMVQCVAKCWHSVPAAARCLGLLRGESGRRCCIVARK